MDTTQPPSFEFQSQDNATRGLAVKSLEEAQDTDLDPRISVVGVEDPEATAPGKIEKDSGSPSEATVGSDKFYVRLFTLFGFFLKLC